MLRITAKNIVNSFSEMLRITAKNIVSSIFVGGSVIYRKQNSASKKAVTYAFNSQCVGYQMMRLHREIAEILTELLRQI